MLLAAHDAAIGNLATSVWQAAAGNTGPYLTKIVAEVSAETTGSAWDSAAPPDE